MASVERVSGRRRAPWLARPALPVLGYAAIWLFLVALVIASIFTVYQLYIKLSFHSL